MKTKLFRSVAVLLMATVMVLGTSTQSMAATTNDVAPTQSSENLVEVATITLDGNNGNNGIMPLNNTVGGTISANGSGTFYPTLDSYVGITKKFCAVSRSNSTSGALSLQLYSPSGKLVSSGWMMGVNENNTVSWNVTLPSSGTWTLKVYAQGTNAPVTFYGWWQN